VVVATRLRSARAARRDVASIVSPPRAAGRVNLRGRCRGANGRARRSDISALAGRIPRRIERANKPDEPGAN
jgi:hypothetical protein